MLEGLLFGFIFACAFLTGWLAAGIYLNGKDSE